MSRRDEVDRAVEVATAFMWQPGAELLDVRVVYRAIYDAALEEAAKLTERYGTRHNDIRRAALEMCAENIRTLKSDPPTQEGAP